MVALDQKSEGAKALLDRQAGAGGFVVDACRRLVGLRAQEVLLPGRIELANVVPEAQPVAGLSRAERLGELAGERTDGTQVIDQVVSVPLSILRVGVCHIVSPENTGSEVG